jgi:hypothetical protein
MTQRSFVRDATAAVSGSDAAPAKTPAATSPSWLGGVTSSRASADLVYLHEGLDGEWRSWRQALER